MLDTECDRATELEMFLKKHGYHTYTRDLLKGDASRRIFTRLSNGNKTFILADADPSRGEEPTAYAAITQLLLGQKLNAPDIKAWDIKLGFFVMEDFGDNLFSSLLLEKNNDETQFYQTALDVLVTLNHYTPQSVIECDDVTYRLPVYDMNRLIAEACLFTQWYVPHLTKRALSSAARDEFVTILRGILLPVVNGSSVLTLRDYHADNLMWLSARKGLQKVGLLDFQDAVLGNRAYDVASLLQDARRDISPEFEAKMLEYYISSAKIEDKDAFMRDYTILAAQRNIKILGIFIRLLVRDKKNQYLGYLPRVWAYLERDLETECLVSLKNWFDRWLPLPLRHEKIAA